MANLKLSAIAAAGSAPASTDQVVGVTTGTVDNLFTLAQIAASISTVSNTFSANQHIASANTLDWNSDTVLSRFGAGILGVTNTTNPTTLQIYNTTDSTTSPTNYERGIFDWNRAANILTIGTQAGGTGTVRNVTFYAGTTQVAQYNTSNYWLLTLQLGQNFAVPFVNLTPQSAGKLTLADGGGGAVAFLQFGGTSSSFPALKRTTTSLGVRLADDSADAPISASTATFSALANVATTSAVCYNTATGVVTYDGTIGTCTVSAAKYKDNFTIIPDKQALDMVLAMKPKSWNYKWEPDRKRIGLVADDLLEVDDRLVGFDAEGKVANDNYWAVITLLVGAVKEQQIMLEEIMANQCQ